MKNFAKVISFLLFSFVLLSGLGDYVSLSKVAFRLSYWVSVNGVMKHRVIVE